MPQGPVFSVASCALTVATATTVAIGVVRSGAKAGEAVPARTSLALTARRAIHSAEACAVALAASMPGSGAPRREHARREHAREHPDRRRRCEEPPHDANIFIRKPMESKRIVAALLEESAVRTQPSQSDLGEPADCGTSQR